MQKKKPTESRVTSRPWTKYSQNIASLKTTDKTKSIITGIVEIAYRHNGVTYEMLETRKRAIVDANIIACKVIHEFFNLSTVGIGSIFNKHHATVIHYVNLWNNTLAFDKECHQLYSLICDHTIRELYGDKLELNDVELDRLNILQLRRVVQDLRLENSSLKNKLFNIQAAYNA